MRAAADGVKRVTLELGGKSPNVIFADADLKAAVRGAQNGIFYGKGEVCAAGSRLLVERSVHDQVMEQLVARAKKAEEKRDTSFAKYHHFEVASAAFQIGIVLASATIITGMMILTWGALALAVIGIGFTAIGLFAPHAVHLF